MVPPFMREELHFRLDDPHPIRAEGLPVQALIQADSNQQNSDLYLTSEGTTWIPGDCLPEVTTSNTTLTNSEELSTCWWTE